MIPKNRTSSVINVFFANLHPIPKVRCLLFKEFYNSVNFNLTYLTLTLLLAFSTPLSWKFSKVLIITIFIVWLLEGDYKRYFDRLRKSTFMLILFAFILFQYSTLLWTQDLSLAVTSLRYYTFWLIVPILAVALKKEQIPTVITTFLAGMFVSETVAYGMFFEFWTYNGHGADYPSPFMHHIAYSIFMAFTAIILLNRIYSSHYSLKEKLFMGLFFITVSGNLFISQGRTGQLAFAIAILVTGFLHFRLRIKTLLLSFTLISVLFFTAYSISPMFEKRVSMAGKNIEQVFKGNLDSSWGARVAWIILGSEIIKDNPLLGIGMGDYEDVAQDYIDNDRVEFPAKLASQLTKHHFHNQYVMIVVQSGLIGLFLFLLLYYYYLRLPIQERENKHLSILFITIYLIGFTAEPLLLVKMSGILFILFTTVFSVLSMPDEDTSSDTDHKLKKGL